MVIDFKVVFERLNRELAGANMSLELVCAGGYVMQLHGYRATADVDAFYADNSEIKKIIQSVGNEFGINKADELWLNNSIANMNPPPPEEFTEIVEQFSNLVVKAVELDYLIGMKLSSARQQDLDDVAKILENDANISAFLLLGKLETMGFNIDISLLLEVFGNAYGMAWLEWFYKENEEELIERGM